MPPPASRAGQQVGNYAGAFHHAVAAEKPVGWQALTGSSDSGSLRLPPGGFRSHLPAEFNRDIVHHQDIIRNNNSYPEHYCSSS